MFNSKKKLTDYNKVGQSFLSIEDEKLPPHVLSGIAKGQADIIAERTISFEDFKKRLSIFNR